MMMIHFGDIATIVKKTNLTKMNKTGEDDMFDYSFQTMVHWLIIACMQIEFKSWSCNFIHNSDVIL